MTQITTIQFEVPDTCGKCRFYGQHKYLTHNEQGLESSCSLGYMDKLDMRDKEFLNSRFEGCRIDKPGQIIKTKL